MSNNGEQRIEIPKAVSYVVVGVNSVFESRKLFKFLRLNGYTDVSVLRDYPNVQLQTFDVPLSNPEPPVPSALEDMVEENSTRAHTRIARTSFEFNCTLCGRDRLLLDAGTTARKKAQNIILLGCLLMQHRTGMDNAIRVYRETLEDVREICLDHFVTAAAFIGHKVKEMHKKFPVQGLHTVPTDILEAFLIRLQVFADCIDDGVYLAADDLIRFFNDCLGKYDGADGWNVEGLGASRAAKRQRYCEANYSKAEPLVNTVKGYLKEALRRKEVPLRSLHNPRRRPPMISMISSYLSQESNQGTLAIPNLPLFESKQEPSITLDPPRFQPKQGPSISTAMNEVKQEQASVVHEGITAADLMEQTVSSVDSTATTSTSTFASEKLQEPFTEKETDKKSVGDKCETASAIAACVKVIKQSIMDDINTLPEEKFRQRFRMSRRTFETLCASLDAHLKKKGLNSTRNSIAVKIGTALDVLAGNSNMLKGGALVESCVTEMFDQALDAIFSWSESVIYWPTDAERNRISDKFSETTGLPGIVGCLGDTTVLTQNSKDLSVAVVVDDERRFRWVETIFEEDESICERSLLCEQLRNGAMTGFLIGDDAYKCESFLYTPSGAKKGNPEDALRRAHKVVQEVIADWKSQFPILTKGITSPKIAHIISGSAALYNLTRAEGDAPFTFDERADDQSSAHSVVDEYSSSSYSSDSVSQSISNTNAINRHLAYIFTHVVLNDNHEIAKRTFSTTFHCLYDVHESAVITCTTLKGGTHTAANSLLFGRNLCDCVNLSPGESVLSNLIYQMEHNFRGILSFQLRCPHLSVSQWDTFGR
ncbi:unnamed protein product [Cylicocyclus nassatus]|uniref:DDE Tnp4 domain-containing protein n=1 Tax=Cylicocyclus nassatus TaxID=53992 RepID=A0AA36GP71_CYLNA|nr:unnamed protein product [Cylicocyclus nassatus]